MEVSGSGSIRNILTWVQLSRLSSNYGQAGTPCQHAHLEPYTTLSNDCAGEVMSCLGAKEEVQYLSCSAHTNIRTSVETRQSVVYRTAPG